MNHLSTHVLDITKGQPVSGLSVDLVKCESDNTWNTVHQGVTNENGRLQLAIIDNMAKGVYKLVFYVSSYFKRNNVSSIYPIVEISFEVKDLSKSLHIPLLLGPFGYTTYRGS